MKSLSRLFGLLLLGLLTGLVLLSTTSCGTTRTGERSRPGAAEAIGGNENGGGSVTGAAAVAGSRLVVQLDAAGTPTFKLPPAQLTTALIRQLHDGTVIDRVLVRAAPSEAGQGRPVYYLIGMGLHNGSFRAIALPLTGSDDGTFYLTPAASRYVLTGTGCPSCYFDFENGRIVGTTCDDTSGGSTCDLDELSGNQVFAAQRTPIPNATKP